MFTSKYRPKKLDDFIGNKNVIMPFIRWLLEWDPKNKKSKCALVSGLNGIGKSLLVELILQKHDYNIIHLSNDEDRNKEYINNTIKPLLKFKKTFNGQENALIVSDIDCGNDYGFMSSLVECIKDAQIPIICICDNRYDQGIKPILNYCYDIKLNKPTYNDIYPLIYKVVTGENIKISKSSVDNLYEQSNGDIRYILNTLQITPRKCDTTSEMKTINTISSHKNIQSANIFDTTGKLLSMDLTLDEKYNTYWLSHDIHGLMIHENYINNTLTAREDIKRLENIAYSADSLSDVDIFDAIMDYDLEPYVALNTIKATIKCNKKGHIKFPQFLGKISTMNKNKRDKLDYNNVKFFDETPIVKENKVKKPEKVKAPEKVKKTSK
jgi:replication factor C subunit 1